VARAGEAYSYIYRDHPADQLTRSRQPTRGKGRRPGPLGTTLLRRDGICSALTNRNSGYSVRSTTAAPAAFFCTDSTPFFALAFDS
jgi:hypothetical protein